MAKPQLLQDRFSLGMKRDMSRDQIPQGGCYDLVDFIPDLEAPLRKRGGWVYEGAVLTSFNAGYGFPRSVSVAPFKSEGGRASTLVDQVVAIEDSTSNRLIDLTNGADRGAAQLHHQAPTYYRGLLIIGGTGTVAPMKYAGSGAPAALAGSPPNSAIFTVYKDFLLAADYSQAVTLANEGRIWFSGAGNPESWTTASRYLDSTSMVVGLAALRNSVIVFHAGNVERIRGDIPPGSSAANMVLEPLFDNIGLVGPNAYAVDGDSVVWADEDGVYQSDGASISDLTEQGGIKNYWIDRAAAVGASGSIAVGIWRGYAVVSLLTSAGANVDFFVCKLKTRAWFRCSNIRAKNFANRSGTTNEFYFSNQSTKQVGELSTIFTPSASAALKSDADSGEPYPQLQTRFFSAPTNGRKRWKFLYLTYDLEDAGTDNPVLSTAYSIDPTSALHTTLTTVAETSTPQRKRIRIGRTGRSMGFLVESPIDMPIADGRIYALEAEFSSSEASRS